MRKNFNEAFGDDDTIPPIKPDGGRLQELEDQIKDMRMKFKKEEASRKQY